MANWSYGAAGWGWQGYHGHHGGWQQGYGHANWDRPGWGPEKGYRRMASWGHGMMAGRYGPPCERTAAFAGAESFGPGQFFASLTPAGAILPRLKALFNRLDRNHDGVLEFREFAVIGRIFHSGKSGGHVAMKQGPQPGPAGHRPMMHRAGPGGPPMRPFAQAAPAKREIQRPMAEQARHLIERLKAADKNRDGKLSKDEAPPLLKRLFSKIDADNDGLLTQAEIKKAMPELRKAIQAHREKGPEAGKSPGDQGANKHHEKTEK
jgi:hypothetical protein